MKIYACGDAQQFNGSGEFLERGEFALVVGFCDLDAARHHNDLGWTGTKMVVESRGDRYVLDLPEEVRIETDSGFLLSSAAPNDFVFRLPTIDDCHEYGLRVFELTD